MKKAKKYIILAIVWAVVSVALFFAERLIYTNSMGKVMDEVSPSRLLYIGKTICPALYDFEEYKEKVDPEKQGRAFLVRGVYVDETFRSDYYSDTRDLGIFSFFDPDASIGITKVYAFASEEQDCGELGFGTWLNIFRRYEELERQSNLYRSVGMMDLERAIEEGYWDEIQFIYNYDKSAVLRLDRYAIRGSECVPIDMTLSTSSSVEKTYHPHDASEFDSSWTICEAADVYAFNRTMQFLDTPLDLRKTFEITDEIKEGRDELNSMIQHVDWNSDGDTVRLLKGNTMTEFAYQISHNPKGTTGTYLMATYCSFQCPDIFTPICRRLIIAWTIAFWAISLVAILIVKAVKKNNQPEENI